SKPRKGATGRPRATPWGCNRPPPAQAPKGRNKPTPAHGNCAPSGLADGDVAPVPRALPWAAPLRPFGACLLHLVRLRVYPRLAVLPPQQPVGLLVAHHLLPLGVPGQP